jgi:hypothetical protein
MTASKSAIDFERAIYQLSRVQGEPVDYYAVESSSPNFETGGQVTVILGGRGRFVLTAAIISEFQLLGRLDMEIADQYFLFLNRDVDFVATLNSYVGWSDQYWKIVRIQNVHGGKLLACKTCQGLVVNE